MRVILALAMLALAAPALGQAEDAPWQGVITQQIEAFRAGDGAAALELAGAGFKAQFKDPDVFYAAIVGSGYGPIVQSRSHSFGEFNVISEKQVTQVVRFVGPDQGLYEALYQLVDEPDAGWRVQGVVMRKQDGVAI